jgi:hypothetical protein
VYERVVVKLSIGIVAGVIGVYGYLCTVREVGGPMWNEKTRTLTRSYTKALKKFDQESHALYHAREQTHLPKRSIDVMSAQPPADYGGGLACFLIERKDKGFHLQPI